MAWVFVVFGVVGLYLLASLVGRLKEIAVAVTELRIVIQVDRELESGS
jgi:hypothetical protein